MSWEDENERSLYHAAKDGKLKEVQRLVEELGVNVNFKAPVWKKEETEGEETEGERETDKFEDRQTKRESKRKGYLVD